MAHILGARMSDKVVAIAPVAGAYYDYDIVKPSHPIAVMAFNGTKDRIAPCKGRAKLPNIPK